VCWRYEWKQDEGKKGRWSKILCTVAGYHAKSNDPSTWTTFDDALAAYSKGGFDGIGFCLGDGWAGIDLDHCIDGTTVIEASHGVIRRLDDFNVYQEVSPSGTGYKAIGRSARVGGQIDFAVTPAAFTPWSRGRFFAVTGHEPAYADYGLSPMADITALIDEWFPKPTCSTLSLPDKPDYIREGDTRGKEHMEIRTDSQVVDAILATAPKADVFLRLCRGDMRDYGNDHSRADQAFFGIVTYYCNDLAQAERLFCQTKLWSVERWDDRPTYRRSTLTKAVHRG
jgi:primase-polymerase (primpol)-like protein